MQTMESEPQPSSVTFIKGRADTEQNALSRIYQVEERDGGVATDIRLHRAQDMSVEYSASIVSTAVDQRR